MSPTATADRRTTSLYRVRGLSAKKTRKWLRAARLGPSLATLELPAHEAASLDRPVAVEDDADGFRIQPMLFDEDARRQRLDRVPAQNRHRCLQHDGTGIEIGVDKVHRRAADPHAVLERLPL